MKSIVLSIMAVSALLINSCTSGTLTIDSPDGEIIVSITTDVLEGTGEEAGTLGYSVQYKGHEIIGNADLGLEFRDLPALGPGMKVTGTETREVNESWERVWGKNKKVINSYNELVVHLVNEIDEIKLDLVVRVYDDGIAIRYHIPEQEKIKGFELTADKTTFRFNGNHRVWAAQYGPFRSHQESEFREVMLDDPLLEERSGLPFLVEIGEKAWVAITEANLTDWAGMYLQGTGDYTLVTVLAPWPEDPELLVKSQAPRSSPAGTDFLKIVPTTWDDTRVLNASVGDYITTARRSGDEWYIGSMTDEEGRTLSIPLDFLGEGSFEASIWKDASDADVYPTRLEKEVIPVDQDAVLEAVMSPGGGHVVNIKKI